MVGMRKIFNGGSFLLRMRLQYRYNLGKWFVRIFLVELPRYRYIADYTLEGGFRTCNIKYNFVYLESLLLKKKIRFTYL